MLLEDNFLSTVLHFSTDELVVHQKYGVGKFLGIENIIANGIRHDCIKLLYDKGDLLYVPVDNMQLIKRYGYDIGKLDRLGSSTWQKRKETKKKAINDYALKLIQISSARSAVCLSKISIDEDRLEAFLVASRFQYTNDQLQAINTTSSTAQGGGGSFKNRKPIGELGCCE